MNKLARHFLFCLVLILDFSCSKTSNNNTTNVAGKWFEISAIPSSNYSSCDFQGSYINFNSNNTYTEFSSCTNNTSIGTYKTVGNTIIVTPNVFPIPVTFNIISLTTTQLILEDTFMGSTDRVTYKR